ncbi:SRSF protein kinase 3-like isoform X2 [Sycon ciliatum]|uniref:SRSF protein kinase 3-like isoform X2 n=1 Tax=Sycon ciliatum TaxID=27933 RepID=UPI0031F713CD
MKPEPKKSVPSSSDCVSMPREEEEEQEDANDYCKGGYHAVRIGDLYNDRYIIIRKLGWGHFSTVWLAWDVKCKRHVALKVVKSSRHYTETALDEIKLLEKVSKCESGNEGKNYVLQIYDHFNIPGPNGLHVCMVFEVLGHNLLKLIVRNNYEGINLVCVKRIIKQVLLGLDCLHRQCQIIHTDIKPENVLVCVNDEHVRRLAALPTDSCGAVSTVTYLDMKRTALKKRHPKVPPPQSPKKQPQSVMDTRDTAAPGCAIHLVRLAPTSDQLRQVVCQNIAEQRRLHHRLSTGQLTKAEVSDVSDELVRLQLQQTDLETRLQGMGSPSGKALSVSEEISEAVTIAADSAAHCGVAAQTSPSDPSRSSASVASPRNGSASAAVTRQREALPVLAAVATPVSSSEHTSRLMSVGECSSQVSSTSSYGCTMDMCSDSVDDSFHSTVESLPADNEDLCASPFLLSNNCPIGSSGSCSSGYSSSLSHANDIASPFGVRVTASTGDASSPPLGKANGTDGNNRSSSATPKPSSAAMESYLDNFDNLTVKIADLGNACWVHEHFSDGIQTRQYRCPEVLLGTGYGTTADVWSVACMTFELATGDYLFEPHSSETYSRDEDHIANIIELLGDPAKRHLAEMSKTGQYAADIFDGSGHLRHIREADLRPIDDVLVRKYSWNASDARKMKDFLMPMLDVRPEHRVSAAEAARHEWLNV